MGTDLGSKYNTKDGTNIMAKYAKFKTLLLSLILVFYEYIKWFTTEDLSDEELKYLVQNSSNGGKQHE